MITLRVMLEQSVYTSQTELSVFYTNLTNLTLTSNRDYNKHDGLTGR